MCLKMFNKFREFDLERTIKDSEASLNRTSYLVWLPKAENIHESESIKMRTRGEYSDGFPSGLVVHCTAGWMLPKGILPNHYPLNNMGLHKTLSDKARKYALNTARYGASNGYNFLVMDVLGRIYQSRPLSKHGYHAGKSYWHGTGYSVSSHFAGVEMLNPGRLEVKADGSLETWYGQKIPKKHARYSEGTAQYAKGWYCMLTWEQEDSLKQLCLDMLEMSPMIKNEKVFKLDNVVAHHEVSPKRKSDVGGSLSVSMNDFRELLHNIKM